MSQTIRDFRRQVIFSNSEVIINGINVILIPTNTFIMFLEAFRKSSIAIDQVLYAIGKHEGKIIYKSLFNRKKYSSSEILRRILDILELTGFGIFELVSFDSKKAHVIIKASNSSLALQYLLLLGKQEYPVDGYICGLFAGILTELFKKNIQGSEIKCIARGNTSCLFEYSFDEKSLLEEETIEELSLSKSFVYDSNLRESVDSPLLQMIFGGELLALEQGSLKIWNISILYVPITTLLIFQEVIIKWFGESVINILYMIGKKQAKSGSEIQMKQYGRKNDKKLYLSMFQHTDLIGMKKLYIKKFDVKRKNVVLECPNNTYVRFYKLLFNKIKPINYYLSGLIAGVSSAFFRTDMDCKEFKIEKHFNSYFEIFEGKTRISEELEDLLDKNLTVKLYLK